LSSLIPLGELRWDQQQMHTPDMTDNVFPVYKALTLDLTDNSSPQVTWSSGDVR